MKKENNKGLLKRNRNEWDETQKKTRDSRKWNK